METSGNPSASRTDQRQHLPDLMIDPIICFGEALWDLLPSGPRPGGAPLNVAVRLRRLGRSSVPVSSVGADEPGDRLLDLIAREGVPLHGITRQVDRATGTVRVRFDHDGSPSYDIDEPAAWDRIVPSPPVVDDARAAVGIVYGTLAQRSPDNRSVLARLLDLVPPDALRAFDANLRHPYDAPDLFWELARASTVIKLNGDELDALCGAGDVELRAREIATAARGAIVCVTLGGEGAGILREDVWTRRGAEPVEVVDTVGVGDAFMAALVDGLLDGRRTDALLGRAVHVAGCVAARKGAW